MDGSGADFPEHTEQSDMSSEHEETEGAGSKRQRDSPGDCIICLESVCDMPHLCCTEGHAICNRCLDGHLLTEAEKLKNTDYLVEKADTAEREGNLATKHKLAGACICPFPSCNDTQPIPIDVLCKHASREAFSAHIEGTTLLPIKREVQKTMKEGNILSQMLPNARMCGCCNYGPVELQRCNDLLAHHGELRRDGSRVSNSCPQCGWLAESFSDWPRWIPNAGNEAHWAATHAEEDEAAANHRMEQQREAASRRIQARREAAERRAEQRRVAAEHTGERHREALERRAERRPDRRLDMALREMLDIQMRQADLLEATALHPVPGLGREERLPELQGLLGDMPRGLLDIDIDVERRLLDLPRPPRGGIRRRHPPPPPSAAARLEADPRAAHEGTARPEADLRAAHEETVRSNAISLFARLTGFSADSQACRHYLNEANGDVEAAVRAAVQGVQGHSSNHEVPA